MGLLVAMLHELHLSVGDDPDHRAILSDLVEVAFDGLLAFLILPLLGVLSEGLLLSLVPVLVEAAFAVLAQMLSENGL